MVPSDSATPDRGTIRESELATRLDQIADWWKKTSDADLARTLDKAQQYDGLDLEMMGQAMAALLPPGLDEQTKRGAGLEMAVAFYALGKITRTFGSFRQGTLPSVDNWFDLAIYAMMARKIREDGRWT